MRVGECCRTFVTAAAHMLVLWDKASICLLCLPVHTPCRDGTEQMKPLLQEPGKKLSGTRVQAAETPNMQ